jgi:hypothetical protein
MTMYDPTAATPAMARLRRADFVLWVATTDPRRFFRLLGDLVRRRLRGAGDGDHVGRMAERHAYSGIDDHALLAAARAHGLEVLAHERYHDARLAPIRFVLRRLDWPSNFRLTLRRAG